MKVVVEISREDYALLAALAHESTGTKASGQALSVQNVVGHLVHSAADGVRRPGSWERGWLTQAFGTEWGENLERDPKCEWHQRPKVRR